MSTFNSGNSWEDILKQGAGRWIDSQFTEPTNVPNSPENSNEKIYIVTGQDGSPEIAGNNDQFNMENAGKYLPYVFGGVLLSIVVVAVATK